MTNSSKQFTSINSFVCHTANSKNLQFPQKQLNLYCQSNECAFEKVINIFNSYYDKFKWNYENFNELILVLSIAVKKIDLKAVSFNQKVKQEAETILKKALLFLEDLITSKMVLVCLASKTKQHLITQHFLYTKGFLNLLVPQLLALQLYNQIIDLLQKCNKNSKSPKIISLNFLVQYMFVSTVIDNLGQQSEDNFRFFVLDLLQEKKQLIFHLLWSVQNSKENQLEFKEIVYLRLDVESPKIYALKITNEDKLVPCQNLSFTPEEWISQAYKKRPHPLIWKNVNLRTVLDIYQFLFKLEVFASSPQIEDLDYLIPNNDEFLQIFSKFLMGEQLVQVKGKKNANPRSQQENQASIIKHLEEIKKVFNKVDKPFKHIFRNQISKFFDDSSQSSDKEKQK